MKILRPGRELTKYGGHGVERLLFNTRSDNAVYWSPRGNSYVAVERWPNELQLASINGIGEIRWYVEEWNKDEESNLARTYFFTEGK